METSMVFIFGQQFLKQPWAQSFTKCNKLTRLIVVLIFFFFLSYQGLSYATCSSNIQTCPDQICDSLEELSRSICPQDCVQKSQIGFPILHEDTDSLKGLGTVKFSGYICSCRGSSCSCMHKDEAQNHSILQEELEDNEPFSSTYLTTHDGKYFLTLKFIFSCNNLTPLNLLSIFL